MPSSAVRNRSKSPGVGRNRSKSPGASMRRSGPAVRRGSVGKGKGSRRNRSPEDVDKIINELMMSNPRIQREERREDTKGSSRSLENLELSIPAISFSTGNTMEEMHFNQEDNSYLSEGGVSSTQERAKKKKKQKKKRKKKKRDPEAKEDSVQTSWTNPQGPTMPYSPHQNNYEQQLPTHYSFEEQPPPQQQQVQYDQAYHSRNEPPPQQQQVQYNQAYHTRNEPPPQQQQVQYEHDDQKQEVSWSTAYPSPPQQEEATYTPDESMKLQGIMNLMASKSKLSHEPDTRASFQSNWSDHQIAELKSLLLPELKLEMDRPRPTTAASINTFKDAAKTVMTLQEAAYAIYNKGDGDSDDDSSDMPGGGKSVMDTLIEKEEDEFFTELSEDVFSFMYMSPIKSPAFVYGIMVFSLQVLVLSLIMSDLLDVSSENPTGIPPGVSSPVTCAQFLALLIVVATQDDMITSLIGMLDGYDDAILRIEPSAKLWKFFGSNGCRLGGGFLYLTVSFFLIIQSTNILGLFLNLAALNFISTLDDVAFSIARNGFISDRLEKLAVIIADLPIPVARSVSNIWRRGFFIAVFGALVTGWGLAVKRQRMGMFQCQSMSITFGSSAPNSLAELTGIYNRTSTLRNLRAVYTAHNATNKLSFCLDEGSWTFSNVEPESKESFDPCRNVTAFMPEDDTYDIASVASSQHFVWMLNDPLDDRNIFDTAGISLHHFQVKCLVNPGAVYMQ